MTPTCKAKKCHLRKKNSKLSIVFIFDNSHCATWAKEGECQKNPNWMLKGCPLSCNECKNDCNDLNIYCKQWADSGECGKVKSKQIKLVWS